LVQTFTQKSSSFARRKTFSRTQELDIRGEVEGMRKEIEAKLAALSAHIEMCIALPGTLHRPTIES
jgi:hypothetical protein